MAITITCLDDANHTISSSKKILSRQGELGETITFSLPSTLNVAYPRAWIMVQQPDGQLYYIDNGSGAGFTWPNPYTFTYDIGDRDTMLSSDGTLGIQIVLRDATPPAQTVEWRSRILYLTIEGSILSNVDSGGSLIDSMSSGTLNRLADIQYDSLADGDLLYRDTATGKWRNVTLVDGLNITHTLNKLTGELTFNSSGTIPLKADNILLDDTAGRISSTQVEGAIAEIAGTGRTTESLANIGLLSSLTTTEKGTVVGSINEVNAQLAQKAPLDSPTFTGTPSLPTGTTAVTQASSVKNTTLATTDYANSLLAEYEVAGSAVTSIDFSGLDINTHKSYRVEMDLYNPTASNGVISMFVNGDTTTTNYYQQYVYFAGATPGYNRDNSAAIIDIGSGCMSGIVFLDISGGYPRANSIQNNLAASSIWMIMKAWAKTATVTNITKLTFTSSVANAIGVGSKIRIYRGDV